MFRFAGFITFQQKVIACQSDIKHNRRGVKPYKDVAVVYIGNNELVLACNLSILQLNMGFNFN